MNTIRGLFYFSILRHIVLACAVYGVSNILLFGLDWESLIPNLFYTFLVLFLRSTLVSPTWSIRLKWTAFVSVPVEALLYGSGIRGHLVATYSLVHFLVNYGFVLNWNPVLRRKDTLVNRVVGIAFVSFILALLSPSIVQTFLVQITLSLHAFWLSSFTVDYVCSFPSIRDPVTRKAIVESVPPLKADASRIPIEVWLLAYDSAVSKLNNFPLTWVDELNIASPVVPWQLRRLIVKAISVDPTKAQMTTLVKIANAQAVVSKSDGSSPVAEGSSSTLLTLLRKGPNALISEEANEKTVINEAIQGLSLLLSRLGERRFTVAFDKSADSKLAVDLISKGFK